MHATRSFAAALSVAAACAAAPAQYIDWADLTTVDGQNTLHAVFPRHPGLTLEYTGGADIYQLDATEPDYWSVFQAYVSETVRNPPRASDLLGFATEQTQTHTLTFSQDVTDPVVAFVSVGQSGVDIGYRFDQHCQVISTGIGTFGDGPLVAQTEPGSWTLVHGEEGHGVVRFYGTYRTLSFTVVGAESWHGLTVGVPITGPGSQTPPCPAAVESVSTPVIDGVCGSATATVSAVRVPGQEDAAVEYRWQRAVVVQADVYFVDVLDGPFDGAEFSGAGTAQLSVQGTPTQTRLYRCKAMQRCDTAYSPAVQLRVDPADVGMQGGEPGHDGLHDNNDMVVFIGYFFTQDGRADVGVTGGEYGADGAFDNNDFVSFINLFFSGCP